MCNTELRKRSECGSKLPARIGCGFAFERMMQLAAAGAEEGHGCYSIERITHLANKHLMTLFTTQQLYMAAGENEGEGSSMGSPPGGSLSLAEPVACAGSSAPLLCSDAILREGQQSEQLCVVCHYFPLSRALLPCRHTCICAICFCEYEKSLPVSCTSQIDEARLRRNCDS